MLRLLRTVLALLLFSVAAPAVADTVDSDAAATLDEPAAEATDEDVVQVDTFSPDSKLPRTCPPTLHWGAAAGYRFWSLAGVVSRVAPYEDAGSGMTAAVSLDRLGKDLKLSADASLVTEQDYQAELDLDKGSQYRFHLSTNAFRHNLDYLVKSSSSFGYTDANNAPRVVNVIYNLPSSPYALDSTFNAASFRYRLANYPLHVNVRLWQFLQEGTRQLRFADYVAGDAVNDILSSTRAVDLAVTEAASSVDGHFGPVDAIYSVVWRQLDDRTAVPSYDYMPRTGLKIPKNPGEREEHNAIAESRYLEQNIALHTSMTGRIVGAASYSLVLRDNKGALADTSMAERPSDTVQNGAADLNLTLSPQVSLVLRYRLLAIDKDGPDSIANRWYVLPANSDFFKVRPAVDLRKNQLMAAILYRPLSTMTIKGEYTGELLHRSGIQSWPLLDESVESHRGSLSIQARPVKGMRLRASYTYTATSAPSYGTSYDQRHDAQFMANYLAPATVPWGGSLSSRFVDERSNYQVSSFVAGTLPRDRSLANCTATVWVSPLQNLTVTGNYGFHRNDTDQTVLFAMRTAGSEVASTYRGEVQLLGLMLSHRPIEPLTVSVGYQHIRSRGSFAPDNDTGGIEEISRVDSREQALSLQGEYRFNRNISCGVDYLFRDYQSRATTGLEGTMHRVMATLSSHW